MSPHVRRRDAHAASINGFWPYPYVNYMYSTCFRAVPVRIGRNHKLFVQEWQNPRPQTAIEKLDIELGADATPSGIVLVPAVSVIA